MLRSLRGVGDPAGCREAPGGDAAGALVAPLATSSSTPPHGIGKRDSVGRAFLRLGRRTHLDNCRG